MISEAKFPRELLAQPSEKRIAYFEQKVIAHPHLTKVFEELWTAINELVPGSLIFVYGPTGVGKTTLVSRLVQRFLETAQQEMEANLDYIPIVATEIAVLDADSFNIRDYYKRLLIALNEPMIDKKLLDRSKYGVGIPEDRHILKSDLRLAVENAFIHRRLKVCVGDEAQHLTRIASGRRLLNQMDILKSLANMTQVTHVFIGTYELIMESLSGQLDRRSKHIGFSRYKFDIPEELEAFQGVILTFQENLPLEVQPNLIALTEFLYERTLGCVGVLKTWLSLALRKALAEKSKNKRITRTILESTALSNRTLTQMAREIRDGEALLKDLNDLTELRSILRISTKKSTKAATKQGQKRKKRPGERKPGRDMVGRDENT